jgi:hypothetical protein
MQSLIMLKQVVHTDSLGFDGLNRVWLPNKERLVDIRYTVSGLLAKRRNIDRMEMVKQDNFIL